MVVAVAFTVAAVAFVLHKESGVVWEVTVEVFLLLSFRDFGGPVVVVDKAQLGVCELWGGIVEPSSRFREMGASSELV